jgi:flagellar export protein FliJ
MTFRFRLDPVLDHRERTERERAGDHARAVAAQHEAERHRDDLIARRDAARRRLTDEHATMGADTLRFTYAHLDYLDRVIVVAEQRVDACVAATAQAHALLVAAARDRKVLETLKDRRREAFLLAAAQAEQRELDDQNARLRDRAYSTEGPSS